MLYRRRWLLLAGVVLGGALGLGAVGVLPPVYTAQTLLLLEPQDGTGASVASALDGAAIDSQAQILA